MAFGSSKQNNISALAIAVASALTVSASAVQAQEEAAVEEKDVEKVVVTGFLALLKTPPWKQRALFLPLMLVISKHLVK